MVVTLTAAHPYRIGGAIVLTGAGAAFSAGADLSELPDPEPLPPLLASFEPPLPFESSVSSFESPLSAPLSSLL